MLNSPVWRGASRYVFCLGLVLGGSTVAAALLVVGSLVRPLLPLPAWAVLVAAFGAAVALRELGLVTFWLPENKRLVPEHVDRHGPFYGPLQFGFEMGTGMRTYLPSALPHLLALAVALLAAPLPALAAGMGFGIGRASTTIANLRYSDDNGWDHVWLRSHGRISAVLVLAVILALGAILL
jgi:hypothetical protein